LRAETRDRRRGRASAGEATALGGRCSPKHRRRERVSVFALVGLLVLAFLGLGARCYYLQGVRGAYFAARCVDQQRAFFPLEPQRGSILDCRGHLLAASNQIRTIFVEPRTVRDPKETATRLAEVLQLPAHELCREILEARNPGYLVVKSEASAAECEAARQIPSVGVRYGWRRHYPSGRLAAHVVGFTSTDNRGLAGIEYAFDDRLRGRGARRTFLVDVRRRPLGLCAATTGDEGNRIGPINGAGIILTIDATVQQFTREAMAARYREFEAEGAMAVVVEIKTGAILAMVSLPDFDPGQARFADPKRFYNRVLTDQFEPGSIMKPITASIALDLGIVNRRETIFCENGHYRGRGFGHIGEYRQGFGDLTLKEILINSSNIGMAKIGQRLGPERLYEGLTLFGFGHKVGVGLPGEAEGLLRRPEQWTGYSVTRIPYGQEVSVTGLQMLKAFCLLANRGRLIDLHVVKALVEPDGSLVDMRPPPLRVGYVIKPEIADWVIGEALAAVVNEGTGRRAKLEEWQVFGKTGTAQIAREDGRGYEPKAYVASFICGAPAEDPRVLVLVSIRRPNVALRKGYTGGAVASPTAAAILKKTLQYLRVPQRADSPSPIRASGSRVAGRWAFAPSPGGVGRSGVTGAPIGRPLERRPGGSISNAP
jgi:cell division protein FtsI/penicillin-binding protein 2